MKRKKHKEKRNLVAIKVFRVIKIMTQRKIKDNNSNKLKRYDLREAYLCI